ncbi:MULTISPECIES: hypothetical protein [unclassified Amedibacterium]|uniref:hypothetical protein n=1 Tax=unclassified Amedibacterium TaxID=3088137 RepID=UPI000E3EFE9D|nr:MULTISPECIES: hypothetical protein [unclassified Absiella]RGB65316.1 hypothetical protein DW113_12115 [Absiella sp. AM09-45]RGB74388.1 hypothetical protein DW114_14150 [Absiella sp. AM09-50]
MWKAIVHRIKTDWIMFLVWGVVIGVICVLQKTVLLEWTLKPYMQDQPINEIESIAFTTKSIIYLLFVMISNIVTFAYLLYRDYDSGKKRFMFLRKHQYAWFIADTIVVFLLLVCCYVFIHYILKLNLISTIEQYQTKVTPAQLEMFYQEAVSSNGYIAQILVMNLRHSGEMLLWLLATSMWCHVFAVSRLLHKQRIEDILVCITIVPLVLCYHHFTMLGISALLCITYCIYMKNIWHPKRMYA